MSTCCMAPTAAIRGVLVDLSGTLHVGAAPVGNAIAALRRLRERLPVRFVTNSSKQSRRALLAELNACGFEGQIADSEIFSSLSAARRLVDGRHLRPLLLLHPDALPDFEGVDTAEPNAVIVGLAKESFTYKNLNTAFRLLLANPDAPLIAMHRGRYQKEPDGLSLGPGPFVSALEVALDRPGMAQVVGKPERSFYMLALDDLGLPPEACVMIGDDVTSDVGGAQAAGMRGVLVRSGKYREGDERDRGVAPDACVADFEGAVDWVLSQL